MDLPYDPRTVGYRGLVRRPASWVGRHREVSTGRERAYPHEVGRGEQGQCGPHRHPEPDAQTGGPAHPQGGREGPLTMKRLWAFIVRLATLHQENDRVIRRAERLNERQRVL